MRVYVCVYTCVCMYVCTCVLSLFSTWHTKQLHTTRDNHTHLLDDCLTEGQRPLPHTPTLTPPHTLFNCGSDKHNHSHTKPNSVIKTRRNCLPKVRDMPAMRHVMPVCQPSPSPILHTQLSTSTVSTYNAHSSAQHRYAFPTLFMTCSYQVSDENGMR